MKKILIIILAILLTTCLFGQDKPYRVGTTAAPFLEMGVGSAAISMGDAYVSVVRDVTSIYWNPSGLAYLNSDLGEVQSMYRPWIAGIKNYFAGAAVKVDGIGTLGLGITAMDFGETEITTMEMQDGTGEMYSAMDYAFSFCYARLLTPYFAFGISGKYITSKISRMSADAVAIDLGVMMNTHFFATGGKRENGLTIGMSISNYGTRMKYDGLELLVPIDISPDEAGNYKDVEGNYRLRDWDLPLIFRLGVSVHPIVTETQKLTLAVDALHPNNNSESLNLGVEYKFNYQNFVDVFLRGGWRGLYMDDAPFGLTLGGGVHMNLNNIVLKLAYAYQEMEYFDSEPTYLIGIGF